MSSLKEAFHPPQVAFSDVLILVAAVATYFFAGQYHQLAAQVVIIAILALSLDLAIGYAGVESLGHAIFFGVGGYAAGLFALNISQDPFLGLLVGAAAGGVLGAASGLVVLQVRGLTQVILTLAIATVILQLATTWREVTGGDDGLSGYSIAPILGHFPFDLRGHVAYLYSLSILLAVYVLCRILVNSPFGATIRGIRDNAQRMRLLGVPIMARLLLVYTISASFAGIAGALSAQITGVIATDSVSFVLSGNVLIILLIGGVARLTGALVGAIIFVVVSDRAAAIDPFHWLFVLGLLLILVVRFVPNGTAVWLDRAGSYFLSLVKRP